MSPITAIFFYLVVILFCTVHAYPILLPRQDPSSSSSSSLPLTLPAKPLHQKPLIQIISPNVTLFAALDVPSEGEEGVNHVEDGHEVDVANSSAPLLLPTASAALAPSQIYHVDDSLMFGAGGSEPLTGLLIEWTLGCDLGDSFPIYPPTERPWIAFISSAAVTLTPTNNTQEEEELDEEKSCTVSTLISIVQAISDSVTGVIMYQDPEGTVAFPELRDQTERAIRNFQSTPIMSSAVLIHEDSVPPSESVPVMMKKRMVGLSREQIMAKLATPGISPYTLDTTPDSTLAPNPSPGPAVASFGSAMGVMAIGDPKLIQILRTSANEDDKFVVAQMTFSDGLGLVPSSPSTPPHPSSTVAERPAADRSLGLFFWIILGSVVLIVGIWVGFGVVEARSLSRRRQQIALDNVKLRTVDQKVLDTYKVRIFQEVDILYSDDEEDDSDTQGALAGTRTQQPAQGGADDSNEKQGQPYHEQDSTSLSSLGSDRHALTDPHRVFARADLSALKVDPHLRVHGPGMSRRSGSYDETLYGGLDSFRAGPDSAGLEGFSKERRGSAWTVLDRDDRCRSWSEQKREWVDYGGESESDYGYDQEHEYRSHAQEGWTSLGVDTIQSLDSTPVDPASRIHPGTISDLDIVSGPATTDVSIVKANASSDPSSPSEAPPLPLLRGGLPPRLRHKAPFILPRKIETAPPALHIVPSEDTASPTVYNDSGSASHSAGPSTAGFLPPIGWGGERRRSSLSTVAVPDNGKGVAQTDWTGPQGQRLRRSSIQVRRASAGAILTEESTEAEEDEEEGEGTSGSEMDDGRGVGKMKSGSKAVVPGAVELPGAPLKARLRRSSVQVHRISFEQPPHFENSTPTDAAHSRRISQTFKRTHEGVPVDYKKRFSMIGIDLPDIYSPTSGEFSRLSLDADQLILQNKQYHRTLRRQQLEQDQKRLSEKQVEELKDSDDSRRSSSSYSLDMDEKSGSLSSHPELARGRQTRRTPRHHHHHHHAKDLTATTTATTATSATTDTGTTPRQRKRRYDPCAICLEEYEVGDQLRELPCKHFFHSECIDPWFKDVHSVCPVCKRDYSEAGRISATGRNNRRQAAAARENERPSGFASFLAPLAVLAAGVPGSNHYWYATEASMHL